MLLGTPAAPGKAPMQASSAGDGYALQHGLYWLASNLAADSPLVLVLDDLQWCDRPSASALAVLARRLEGQPLGLILRPGRSTPREHPSRQRPLPIRPGSCRAPPPRQP